MNFIVQDIKKDDNEWISKILTDRWSSHHIVSRGVVHDAIGLPGFIADADGERVGLIVYHIKGDSCEIVSLDSVRRSQGVGTALVEKVKEKAIEHGCKRLWLVTTNDNVYALHFYQKRGFRIAAVHINALEHSRKLKPEIPEMGIDGIPLRDEIELHMSLLA